MQGGADPLAGSDDRDWVLIDDVDRPGAANMAMDEWLMESVRRGGAPTLRLYGWNPPCLSLGRNQPTGPLDRDRLRAAGVEVVRRMTGGRAVLHDRELTYAVVVAARTLGSPRTAYGRIHEILVEALSRSGWPVRMAAPGGASTPIPSTAPCFAEPVAGEILLGDRKLVGSAQVHIDGVLLQHGSVLLAPSPTLEVVEGALGRPVEGECAYLRPDAGFRRRFRDEIARTWSERVGEMRLGSSAPAEAEVDARVERFRDPEWTFRR